MKKLLLFAPLLLLATGAVRVNAQTPGKNTAESPLAYPSFIAGKVFMKDNSVIDVSLNYNRVGDEILFVQPDKKDTLAISEPEKIDRIAIGSDTYKYMAPHGFLKQLTAAPAVNLLEKEKLAYLGTAASAGGYGGYSNTSATQSATTMNNRNAGPGFQTSTQFGRGEKSIYTVTTTYFLANKANSVVLADKKGFNKLFPKHDKELKDYADANSISFTKKEDLEKLLQYAQTLN